MKSDRQYRDAMMGAFIGILGALAILVFLLVYSAYA